MIIFHFQIYGLSLQVQNCDLLLKKTEKPRQLGKDCSFNTTIENRKHCINLSEKLSKVFPCQMPGYIIISYHFSRPFKYSLELN